MLTGTTLSDERVAALRAATPGCAHVIHFNHAGSSLPPRPVLDAVIDHLRLEAAIGGYEAYDAAEERIEAVYDSIAHLLNAHRDEIALVENATRGWDMAVYAIPFRPGDRVLTTLSEYSSNVIALLQIARRGVSVEVIPNDEHGQVSVAALESMLDDRVRAVFVSHMPTNGGLVQPAEAIGRVLRKHPALYVLDACQTAGQVPLDVARIGCDVLSATSRKYLRGPRGVGFLYVRREVIPTLTPPLLDNLAATWTAADAYTIREDARRFENWESYVAGRLGLGAAVDYALDLGLEAIWERVQRQAARLRARLSAIPGVTVRDLGAVKGGIVTFTHDGVPPETIKAGLAARTINVTTSSLASTRYDMEARGLPMLTRASVHYLTTDEEIEALAAALETLG
ncbi:MAG TPA: aminotransferase class V-fold PLP-dependent enzyme [Solirubrobacteraceae bacterium]|nr:aminotransferase class V-fold PLP-dependent enzyme [Solirubrobacteraceae bacterium]